MKNSCLQKDKFSSNKNEVIRVVLNFLMFFFYENILYTPKVQKSTKKHKKHKKAPKVQKALKAQKHNQAKAQNANKQTKIKNAFKKHLSGKK